MPCIADEVRIGWADWYVDAVPGKCFQALGQHVKASLGGGNFARTQSHVRPCQVLGPLEVDSVLPKPRAPKLLNSRP